MIHRDDKEPIEGIIVKESKSVKATEAPISETFHGLVLEEDAEPVQVEVIDQNLPNSENEKSAAQLPARFVPARENQTQQSQSQSQQQRQDTGHALKTYSRNITINESEEDDDLRRKGRIGDRMVEMGLISKDQLNVALQEKKITGKMLGEVMVDLGFIDEETLSAFIAQSSGVELFDPQNTIFDGEVLGLITKEEAAKHKVLPVSMSEHHIKVAMADPYDIVAMDMLRRFIPKGLTVKPMVCTPKILSEAIDAAYGYASSVNAILQELEEGKEQKDVASLDESEAFSHPIVRLVNALVFEAVKIGASDLHFEPEENFIRLRYRKDGVLFTAQILHKQHWSGISQRIKIMSGMNIADKLGAQDGRFGMHVGGREADFRVSSLPTVHGENIVLRVLDQSESIMPMEKLGFSNHNRNLIRQAQSKPEGIIIVTGPTGSGKTTSLYSMLNEINDVEVNIQTLEDPVEYSLPMIRQTHVREGVLEFADGIKALLRQDPDIIFIGEIRDGETAGMALKAAMTGHQVYTTLHTNDSFGAIPRLFDLGLKPGMVAGAIVAVFAQRLTRRLCPVCKEAYQPDAQECEILGADPANMPTIYRARQGGCDSCSGSGYKGRTAVVEILTFDEEMDELLARGANKAELKAMAVKKGFKSMKDDGILKVLEGVTSLEALAKVVDIRR
ncbi:MAG: Flp pilus assembly complex ATPase component TadA [Rhodospirillales bacterium]|nr:MAG: Flp pilus assembly complex ATPase component TadA [Rhodospirillales bacterium]